MAVRSSQYQQDLSILKAIGERLDDKCKGYGTVRDFVMAAFLKINDKRGRLVPFIPNDGQQQIAARWGRKNIVLKARQLGISTYVAARFFIDTITRPGTVTLQVAHDQRSAEDLFRIVHRFQENLPKEMSEGVLKPSRSNVRQIRWPELDSEYRVDTAADPNAGRGMTVRNLHCSEVAMWSRDGAEALVSLRAAVPPDGQIVLESTPKGAGGVFYEEWHAAAETGYVQHFLPWWVEKAYTREGFDIRNETNEELDLMCKHDLTVGQLLYRREIRANLRGKAAQEYAEDPEECFLLSGDCVFDLDNINQRLKECEMPKGKTNAVESRDNGRELIFLPAQPKREYIVAVDPASGSSRGDYSCVQVIEKASGLQCAELRGHFDPHETAVRAAKLAGEYNRAMIVVERNNHGQGVYEVLKRMKANLYEDRMNRSNGWVTTVSTRPRIIEFLGELLRQEPGLFASTRLLQECRTFLRNEDGTSGAASGAHDDTVMAMAIAQYVRQETSGKHLCSEDDSCGADIPAAPIHVSRHDFSSVTGFRGDLDAGSWVEPSHAAAEQLLAQSVSPG
jgi:hypothetical protein